MLTGSRTPENRGPEGAVCARLLRKEIIGNGFLQNEGSCQSHPARGRVEEIRKKGRLRQTVTAAGYGESIDRDDVMVTLYREKRDADNQQEPITNRERP